MTTNAQVPQKWQNPERGFNHLRLWESFILKVVKIPHFPHVIKYNILN